MRFDMRGAMVTFALLILFVYPSVSALDPTPIQSGGFEYTLETLAEPEGPWIDWDLELIDGKAIWIGRRYDVSWWDETRIVIKDIDNGTLRVEEVDASTQAPIVMGDQLIFRRDYSTLVSRDLPTGEEVVLFENVSRIAFAPNRIAVLGSRGDLYVHYPENGTTRLMDRVRSTGDLAISDRWVGWADGIMPTSGVVMINLENGTRVHIEGGRFSVRDLDLDGDRAVWVKEDDRIMLTDLVANRTLIMSRYPAYNGAPVISGDLIVWSGSWPGIGTFSNLFVHHIPSGETMELELNYTEEFSPSIEGNMIAFFSGREYTYSVKILTMISVPEAGSKGHRSGTDPDDVLGVAIMTFLALTVILVVILLLPERRGGHGPSTRSRQGSQAKGQREGRSGSRPPDLFPVPVRRSSR